MRRLPKVVTREKVDIVLVDDQAGVPNLGVVEAVAEEGPLPRMLERGVVVWFEPWMGKEIGWMGETLVVVDERDVLAVLEKVPGWVVERLESSKGRWVS